MLRTTQVDVLKVLVLALTFGLVGCPGGELPEGGPLDGSVDGGLLDGSVDAALLDGGAVDRADGAAVDAGPTDGGVDGGPAITVMLPRTGITASELAILVNDDDPQSVALAQAYQTMRGIPADNVVHLRFTAGGATLSEDAFLPIYQETIDQVGDDIQAFAITWTRPFRVDCMSITSAFALGFDRQYCNTSGMTCGTTAQVDYFDSDSTRPFTDHGIRPAVMLAASDTAHGLELIARGIAGDDTLPVGDGYLVRTTDSNRSVRYPSFAPMVQQWSAAGGLDFTYIDNADGSGSNSVADTEDVLFYFTGLSRVPDIETNTYLPGALADHLTSSGGRVPTSGQMSVVEWLESGVTGSYGTVIEPCNYTAKFPNVPVLVERYFRGQTLVEAYWKSVRMPGEGLFVGEPLSHPFGAQSYRISGTELSIETNAVVPGEDWEVQSAASEAGPWTTVRSATADNWQRQTIGVPLVEGALYYRLQRVLE